MAEMTGERAIEVLTEHQKHWERLLREKICDKKEGVDFIVAIDMAVLALQNMDILKNCKITEDDGDNE